MKKHFYLMRHGQTLFNVRKKSQGWCDSPLTELGIQQAQQAADYIDTLDIDHLYSSTSERACDTAELATRNQMPYQRMKGLKEFNFGVFEGECADLEPGFAKMDHFYLQFGGDSTAIVQHRMRETCIELMERDNHHNVLAVSHAGASVLFLSLWHDINQLMKTKGIPNCAILKFEYSNQEFKFIELIDTAL